MSDGLPANRHLPVSSMYTGQSGALCHARTRIVGRSAATALGTCVTVRTTAVPAAATTTAVVAAAAVDSIASKPEATV